MIVRKDGSIDDEPTEAIGLAGDTVAQIATFRAKAPQLRSDIAQLTGQDSAAIPDQMLAQCAWRCRQLARIAAGTEDPMPRNAAKGLATAVATAAVVEILVVMRAAFEHAQWTELEGKLDDAIKKAAQKKFESIAGADPTKKSDETLN